MEGFEQDIFLSETTSFQRKKAHLQCFSQFMSAQVCLSGLSQETWQQRSCSSFHQLPTFKSKPKNLEMIKLAGKSFGFTGTLRG